MTPSQPSPLAEVKAPTSIISNGTALSPSQQFRQASTTSTTPRPDFHPKSKMPPSTRDASPNPATLHLPRILCLHGGGVNSLIFKSQLRSFLNHEKLASRYRFVFVDAPFECAEGVGVYPVYKDWGPFKRWSRWLESHEKVAIEEARELIWDAVLKGMEADDDLGADGEWDIVLGFSQGAKVACSLLYEQCLSRNNGEESRTNFKMGIIFAGRAPFLALSQESEGYKWMQSAGGIADGVDLEAIDERPDLRLSVPTLHVHGLKDDGLKLHRRAVEGYCAPGTAEVVEWDGPHRLPIKSMDVEQILGKWMEMGEEYGI